MPKINQHLLDAIAKKTKLKQRQVYNLVGKAAIELMLPRNLAALVVASNNGINIHKYASTEELATIREARSAPPSGALPARGATNAPVTRKLKGPQALSDPFIDAMVVAAAQRNAELYPIMYTFENSVRNVISIIMQSTYGDDWWEQKVSETIRQRVHIRQSEEKQYPWHSQRGAANISYTDISDLRTIINTFNKDFKRHFGKIPRVEMWIEEIEKTRNTLAHNNPVSKKDRDRLSLFADDWNALAKKIFDEVC